MRQSTAERMRATTLLSAVPAVAVLSPTPTLSSLTAATSGDPLAPLVAAVGLAAWGCAAWLLLTVLASVASDLPGPGGRAARSIVRVAPASVRALVRAATGLALAGTVLSAPTAGATEPTPAPTVTKPWEGPSFDWPTAEPATAHPTAATSGPGSASTDPRITRGAPTGRPAPDGAAPSAVPAVGPAVVVVQPGDTLWAIAARALGEPATAARVAAAWPAWWSANRAVLGADPDLIHPGTALVDPSR